MSALPAGFAVFLAGRALQGAGFGLVPLATAGRPGRPARRAARPHDRADRRHHRGRDRHRLPADRAARPVPGARRAVLVRRRAQRGGPGRRGGGAAAEPAPARSGWTWPAAVLLGLGIAGLLLVLARGPGLGLGSAHDRGLRDRCPLALLAAWAGWELRARRPLIDLRLLRRRPVLAANVTAFLVAVGFYPLGPLVVRFVQTPACARVTASAPPCVDRRADADPVLAGQLRRAHGSSGGLARRGSAGAGRGDRLCRC